eukprot:70506-Hanusia_phi.AAC.1
MRIQDMRLNMDAMNIVLTMTNNGMKVFEGEYATIFGNYTVQVDVTCDSIQILTSHRIIIYDISPVNMYLSSQTEEYIYPFQKFDIVTSYISGATKETIPNYMMDGNENTAISFNSVVNDCPELTLKASFESTYIESIFLYIESQYFVLSMENNGITVFEKVLTNIPKNYLLNVNVQSDSINITTDREIIVYEVSPVFSYSETRILSNIEQQDFSIFKSINVSISTNSGNNQISNYVDYVIDMDPSTAIVFNTKQSFCSWTNMNMTFEVIYIAYIIIDISSSAMTFNAHLNNKLIKTVDMYSPAKYTIIQIESYVDTLQISTDNFIIIRDISAYQSFPSLKVDQNAYNSITDYYNSMPPNSTYFATDDDIFTVYSLNTPYLMWTTFNVTLPRPVYLEQIGMNLDWSSVYQGMYNIYLYLYDNIVTQYTGQTNKLFKSAISSEITSIAIKFLAKDPSINNVTGNSNCYYSCLKYIPAITSCQSTYCMKCPPGTYKSDIHSESCSKCPVNSISPAGSISIDECNCKPGYIGFPGGSCTACPEGKYKYNSYYCASCPSNTYSPLASENVTQCSCKEGYEGYNGWACIACSEGKYKPFTGEGKCIDCPQNTLSSKGTVNLTGCYCPAGFYQNSSTSTCTVCPKDTYNDKNSQTYCKNCIPHSTSPIGSISIQSCSCEDGYIYITDQFRCKGCTAGKYKIAFDTCAQCPVNSYSNNGSQFRTQCKCDPGYFGNDGESCTPCPAGTYKDVSGSSPCILCGSNEYSVDASTSKQQCVCSPGYYRDNEVCKACPFGTYQNATNQTFCYSCQHKHIATLVVSHLRMTLIVTAYLGMKRLQVYVNHAIMVNTLTLQINYV